MLNPKQTCRAARIGLWLLVAVMAMAQDQAATKPSAAAAPVPLTETQSLRLQLARSREQLAAAQLQASEQYQAYSKALTALEQAIEQARAAHNLDSDWVLDEAAMTFVKRLPAVDKQRIYAAPMHEQQQQPPVTCDGSKPCVITDHTDTNLKTTPTKDTK
jgi:hypothetical protein